MAKPAIAQSTSSISTNTNSSIYSYRFDPPVVPPWQGGTTGG